MTTENPGTDPLDTTADTSGQIGEDHWLHEHEGFDDDARKALSKYGTVDDALKGAVEAQKLLGKSVRIPGDDASDDDKVKFRDKVTAALGRPETAEDYQIERPNLPDGMDYNEDAEKAARKIAHEQGLSNDQFKAMFDLHNQLQTAVFEQIQKDKEAEVAQTMKELNKEWGSQTKGRIELGLRLVKQYGGEGFAEFLNKSGLGNNMQMIKFCDAMAQLLVAEGVTVQGAPPTKPLAGSLRYKAMEQREKQRKNAG